MAVTKFQFINKKYLNITLQNLIHQQYIYKHSVSKYTLYKPADNGKIEFIISKFQNIEMINLILSITEEKYFITAEFYEVMFIFWVLIVHKLKLYFVSYFSYQPLYINVQNIQQPCNLKYKKNN